MCASRPSLDVHLGNLLRTMYVVFTRHGWASGGLQTPQGGRGDGQEAQNGGLVDLFGAHRRVGEFGAECGVECGMGHSRNISQMASF